MEICRQLKVTLDRKELAQVIGMRVDRLVNVEWAFTDGNRSGVILTVDVADVQLLTEVGRHGPGMIERAEPRKGK